MSNKYIDESEVRKAISVIKNGSVTNLYEVRIINKNKREPLVGYFTDVNTMLRELEHQDLRDKNVYMVLNEINKACYAQTARDTFIKNGSSTQDTDIIGRWWLLIDFDPNRPTDTSASDNEIKKADGNGVINLEINYFLNGLGGSSFQIVASGVGVKIKV